MAFILLSNSCLSQFLDDDEDGKMQNWRIRVLGNRQYPILVCTIMIHDYVWNDVNVL